LSVQISTHDPCEQAVRSMSQVLPHPPQLRQSVCVLTHCPLQHSWPALHWRLQRPQWFLSVLILTQWSLQTASPLASAQHPSTEHDSVSLSQHCSPHANFSRGQHWPSAVRSPSHDSFGTHSPATQRSLKFEQHSRKVPSPLSPQGVFPAVLQQELSLNGPGLMHAELAGQHWPSCRQVGQQPPLPPRH
jgi:hypothetical protein